MSGAIPLNGQTWVICGGRDFADRAMFDDTMSNLIQRFGCPSRIVHGGATGADSMAAYWGSRMGIAVARELAAWGLGKVAGPLRNQRMLDGYKPSVVVAFPGGRGTADMVCRAHAAEGVNVIEIKPTTERSAPNPNTEQGGRG